ncbi:MAG: alpha-L-arabinofuranosidase C-terminal domain-containing protein [Candidatus Woesearchaeota archaeon]
MKKNSKEVFKFDKFLKFTSKTEKEAEINIETNIKGKRVSERLFGAFVEHLGNNVYDGIWAQIFKNGGFESYNQNFKDMNKENISKLEKTTNRKITSIAKKYELPLLTRYKEYNIAPYWGPAGEKGEYYLDKGFDNGTAQKITSSESNNTFGVETPIFLPLYRISSYKFACQIFIPKKEKIPKNIYLQIMYNEKDLDSDYKLLVEEKIKRTSILNKGKWNSIQRIIEIPKKEVKPGDCFKFKILFGGRTTVLIDNATLFPTDEISGWDPEVIKYLKDMELSVLRFPGGNFVSGYHWQDGIGPVEKRPEKPNPAWPEWESNQVGTDEWLNLCELIGAEPLICVNAGNGTSQEAANWVHYCNDSCNTSWGKLRAENGHPAPYNVHLWEIGNELWGKWQINYASPQEYGDRCEKFALTMKDADPSINLISIGGNMNAALMTEDESKNKDWYEYIKKNFVSDLYEEMINSKEQPAFNMIGAKYARPALEKLGNKINSIAEHAVMGAAVKGKLSSFSPDKAYRELVSYAHNIGRIISKNQELLKEIDDNIGMAQTEQSVAVRGENMPNDDSITSALIWSMFMNWFLRSEGFVSLFTRSMLGRIIKKERGVVYLTPDYYAQKMYTEQPGRIPVTVNMKCPVIEGGGDVFIHSNNIPCLDTVALLSSDKQKLTLICLNIHPEKSIDTKINIKDFSYQEEGDISILGGASISSRNFWFSQNNVQPLKKKINLESDYINLMLPSHSLTVLTVSRR